MLVLFTHNFVFPLFLIRGQNIKILLFFETLFPIDETHKHMKKWGQNVHIYFAFVWKIQVIFAGNLILHNNSQSILSAMRRKPNHKTTQILVYQKEKNKVTKAYTLPSIYSQLILLSSDRNTIFIPSLSQKDSIEETYHDKVNSCRYESVESTRPTSLFLSFSTSPQLRIARQSQQDVLEIFTITEPAQVSKLVEMMKQAHEWIYGNNNKKYGNGLICLALLRAKAQRWFESIKIAWTSNPIISFKPGKAMKWLEHEFQTDNFFFPSEKTHLKIEDFEDLDDVSPGFLECQKILLQLRHSLAVYLRKAITLRCETLHIPSELAKLEKIRKYAQHHSRFSQTLNGIFQSRLADVIENGLPKNIRHIHKLEEEYFQHIEQQAQRLINQLDDPASNKPSKRSKRNMKKAQAAKMKKQSQKSSSQNTSDLSINPEEGHAAITVVEENAYKIGEQEEVNLTMDSLVQEPKQQINIENMFVDYFVQPLHRRKDSDQTSHDQRENNPPESLTRGKNNKLGRNSKKKYEQKAANPIKFIDFQFQAQKVATNVVEKLLQAKLLKLQAQNKQINQLKNNAYNKLLSYFAVRLPCFSVNIFGSLASGVSLPSSDIDILLTPQVPLYLDQYFLSDLANELNTFGWVTYCSAILTAKIPVIKLIIDPYVCEANPQSQLRYYSHDEQLNTPFLIKFDITLNTSGQNNTGLVSTAYMQNIFNFRPKLIEAMLIIKHLLEKADLNQGYKGGISSYNIFLMMICFAQHSHFSFDATLSEFLNKFFTFYSKEFDYQQSVLRYECGQNCVLSCKEYSLLPNAENISNSGAIKMIDPINGKLVRASFSRFEEVLDLFRRLAQAFGGVTEEARLAVQPLMGKPYKKRADVAAIAQTKTQNSKSSLALAQLLLIE